MLKKVVFDMDDTLWSLNEKAVELANIDYNKLITFMINDNPLLTDEEKENLMKVYMSPDLFKNVNWFEGIERINDLNADVHINSNIFSTNVDNIKRVQLHDVLRITDDKIHLNLVTDAKNKPIDNDTFIFVDDSPYNIINSPAPYNLMLKRPWNTSDEAKIVLGNKPIHMFDSLNEIIDYIETLL